MILNKGPKYVHNVVAQGCAVIILKGNIIHVYVVMLHNILRISSREGKKLIFKSRLLRQDQEKGNSGLS